MTGRDSPAIELHHLSVTRTARYAVLGSLTGSDDVWFVCHGFGQLASRFLSRFAGIAAERRLIVAPEGLSRYYLTAPKRDQVASSPVGATWMTAEDREAEISDYVGYLDHLYNHVFTMIDRRTARVTVLGFSQGVATVCRWLALGDAEADRVILWAGMIPPELTAAGAARLARDEPLTMVIGRTDEFATDEVVASEEARLRGLAVPFRTLRFDGGHEVSPAQLALLAER